MAAQKILWLKEVDKEDIDQVGRLAAHLGDLMRQKFEVPNGFVVTKEVFESFVEENKLKVKVTEILRGVSSNDKVAIQRQVKHIRNLIINSPIPEDFERQIISYYMGLNGGMFKQPYVAVRPETVFKEHTYSLSSHYHSELNVYGESNVILSIKEQWAQLFDEGNIRKFLREREKSLNWQVAVIVQKMIEAEVSGLMTTINPVSGQRNCAVIEAVYGLGDVLIEQTETPDHYEVNKYAMSLVQIKVAKQEKQLLFRQGKNQVVKVDGNKQLDQKLTDLEIGELTKIGKQLEQYYLEPQEVEWAWYKGKFYILNTKPVNQVVVGQLSKLLKRRQKVVKSEKLKVLVSGIGASRGIRTGKVRKVRSIKEMEKVKKGEIVVLDVGSKDYFPVLKKAKAVIVDEGGFSSEITIVCRETGMPCVVGTEQALRVLKDGLTVTVDGVKGLVYAGALKLIKISIDIKEKEKQIAIKKTGEPKKTATKIEVLIKDKEKIKSAASLAVDGGLVTCENLVNSLKYHPDYLVDNNKDQDFSDNLVNYLEATSDKFAPRSVIFRLWDADSREARELVWGKQYENEELNPKLGIRGANRYMKNTDLAELQIKALEKVRKKLGKKNLEVMIPFVRSVDEVKEMKKLMAVAGVVRSASMKIWVGISVPSNYVMLSGLAKLGIDGVVINYDELCELMLGVELNNERLGKIIKQSKSALVWMIKKIVKKCHKLKLPVTVMSETFLDDLDIIEDLVEAGVSRLVVSARYAERLREMVYLLEGQTIRKRSSR